MNDKVSAAEKPNCNQHHSLTDTHVHRLADAQTSNMQEPVYLAFHK